MKSHFWNIFQCKCACGGGELFKVSFTDFVNNFTQFQQHTEITLRRLADVENYSEFHAAGIVRDVLKGVQYLHGENIIHANIKVSS